MSTIRHTLRAAIRSSSTSIARSSVSTNQRIVVTSTLQSASRRRAVQQQRLPLASRTQQRWDSSAPTGDEFKLYDFEKIKSLTANPSKDKILIDVREPHEYKTHIPTAYNMPISSQPDALFLPAPEFADRFHFPKPTSEMEVIFYCKAGVRSSAAADLARQVGYKNVGEYRGSWVDWVKMGGDEEGA